MRKPGGVLVWWSVCAPWVSFWVWLLMGVNVARLVGDGVAVVVRPDAVRCVVAHVLRLLRSCKVCQSPRLEAVGACWSVCDPYTLYI